MDFLDHILHMSSKQLVTKGFSAIFSYKYGNLGKQLKEASEKNAQKCVIIGDEFKDHKLAVKDMATGDQTLVDYDEFLSGLNPA